MSQPISANTLLHAKPAARKFQELRLQYPVFSYDSYHVARDGANLKLSFDFRIHAVNRHLPDFRFNPSLIFRQISSSWQSRDLNSLHDLAFHLGLIEMFSYWKATCSPQIIISAGHLSLFQIDWWKDLLLQGMGEFFYVNEIDFTSKDFVTIVTEGFPAAGAIGLNAGPESYLVPIGGGRDSALTAEVLRQAGFPFRSLLLNPTPAAQRVSKIAGCAEPVLIDRTLDPFLLELNNQGFLNGHTPFSACLAFISAVSLILYGGSTIVISNERSSNEASTDYLLHNINHQYSKSAKFEADFDEYLRKFLIHDARYVSFVRSLYELQIGKAFARLPQYFSSFRSCNRNQKFDSWCGQCAKCLSVFITLYPFIGQAEIVQIFADDLFRRETTLPILRQLAGLEGAKPLDCVCTRDETIAALHLCLEKIKLQQSQRPPALAGFESTPLYNPAAGTMAGSILRSRGPDRLEMPLRNALEVFLAKC